jgi:putative nucleotidyltransferase with HDIG domain
VILSDTVSWQYVVGGTLVVFGYTSLLYKLSKASFLDLRRQRWVRLIACAADIAIISLSIAVSHGNRGNLYILYILPIVWTGYVARRWQTICAVAAASLAGDCAGSLPAALHLDFAAKIEAIRAPLLTLLLASAISCALFIFKNRDEALLRRDRKLSSLLEVGTTFDTGEDIARLMEHTLRAAIGDTDATNGYIMLLDDDTGELLTEVAISSGEEKPFPRRRKPGEGVEGYAAATGKPLILANEQVESAGAKGDLSYDGEAALCIPMIESSPRSVSRVIGVFCLFKHKIGSRFVPEDVDLVRTVSGLTTMAVVNSRLYEHRRSSFLQALQALANTLEAKDRYTRGHSYRVAELCVLIASELKVAPDMVEDLRNGALMHDIGKIGIPDEILCKPGRLTDDEFETMKQHPIIGFEICQPLGLTDQVLMLIRNHHEKLDGSGYPDGLKLGELPLLLRIICVADAFDAMSSSRPYRTSMDGRLRNEQLNRFAGTQFDPIVVEALKKLLFAGELNELYKDQWVTEAQLTNTGQNPVQKAA